MKKKKTYAAVMLVAGLLSLLGCVPAFADAEGFSEEYSRFQDPDGILSGDEAEELNEKLDEISHDQEFDVTAALVNSLGGSSVQDYADDLYDMCDFGYGADRDGVLLLVSLEDHDWYISTSGYGITAFTDAGIQYIGEQIKPDLADGNYLDAFETYADQCDNFINQANSGEPYDVDHMPKEPLSPIWFGISFIVGLGGALLVVGVMGHIAIQVILNIAVVTNTIPNTGITLPFISYGGTSVLFIMMEMGIVLSVSNRIRLEK